MSLLANFPSSILQHHFETFLLVLTKLRRIHRIQYYLVQAIVFQISTIHLDWVALLPWQEWVFYHSGTIWDWIEDLPHLRISRFWYSSMQSWRLIDFFFFNWFLLLYFLEITSKLLCLLKKMLSYENRRQFLLKFWARAKCETELLLVFDLMAFLGMWRTPRRSVNLDRVCIRPWRATWWGTLTSLHFQHVRRNHCYA